MAEDIVTPGVTRSINSWDGSICYEGPGHALRTHGLIPEDVALPGKPGKRGGIRWMDAKRVCWVMSAGVGDRVYVRSIRKPREREQYQRKERVEAKAEQDRLARLETIDQALSSWGDSKEQFSYMLNRCVDATIEQVGHYAWDDSAARGPWTWSKEAKDKLHYARVAFVLLLQEIEPTFDPNWRPSLQVERDLLRSDVCTPDDASSAAAAVVLATASRGSSC